MKEADYISKSEIRDPELEFEHLRNTGIEISQKLSGSKWTDYNIHDPGVTILEQLCFAVTELGYKTSFDIKDLLASQQNGHNVNDTFYSPAEILHGKPITINDFRKILIDRVDGLRDVWIEPLNLSSGKNNLKGTYIVLVKPSPKIIKTSDDRQKLLNDTSKCLEKYSNLGEAFDEIIILKQEEIYVSAEIDLKNEANAEHTHASVLYHIEHFISSPIAFCSLDEMIKTGMPFEEIFSGPRLLNGFIKDEVLGDKVTTFLTSQLINVVYNVEGVDKVRNLKIQKAGKERGSEPESFTYQIESRDADQPGNTVMDDGVLIEMNKVPVLAEAMMPYNPAYKPYITYYQNQTVANLFQNNVIRYLRQIQNENRVKYSDIYQKSNDIFPEKGRQKTLNQYFSIQEQFPAIYALGKRGIPPHFDQNRVSQVKQLKTYLLLFEQIITNYLAQLANFSDLFSLDEDLTRTYFAGSLESIPHINELVEGISNQSNQLEIEHKTSEISRQALRTIDDFHNRRHQVLDHLLARFGERMSNFGISKFNYYYNNEELLNRMIMSKVGLLKEMIFLSSKRARSFNAFKKYWEEDEPEIENNSVKKRDNFSYLEKKARLRLGIQSSIRKLAVYLEKQIGEWKPTKPLIPENLFGQIFKKYLVHDKLVLNSITHANQIKDDFDPGIEIDSELLRRGIWLNNYKIITDKDDKKLYFVGFSRRLGFNVLDIKIKEDIMNALEKATKDINKKPDYIRFWNTDVKGGPLLIEFRKMSEDNYHPVPSNVWVILQDFDTRSQAEEYTSYLINFLIQANKNTEGFYLIDHIELRPRKKANLYGIVLNDRKNKIRFESAEHYSFIEMQDALFKLVDKVRDADYVQKVTAAGTKQTILIHNGTTIGYIQNYNQNIASNGTETESKLKDFFYSLTDFDLYDPNVIDFILTKDADQEKQNGLFYSFRISIVIPAWPARFADLEFRKVLESTIREDTPAHIGVDFYYLDFEDLKRFENLYSQWLTDMREHTTDNLNKLNASSKKLSELILGLEADERKRTQKSG